MPCSGNSGDFCVRRLDAMLRNLCGKGLVICILILCHDMGRGICRSLLCLRNILSRRV